MGLRTARRPCAEVMAPALTETTTQSQTFKLAPKEHQPASPLGQFGSEKYLPHVDLGDALLATTQTCNSELNAASDNTDIIMSDSPTSMGDHKQDKMGLQKTNVDSVSKIHNDNKTTNEVDQLLNNLTAADVDLPQNVDELMQVIKSIEGNPQNELEDNLTIEKFLTDVDMMNMSMEDQQELEAANLKETQTRELIAELKKRQNKIERRLDFLRRKVRKMQARHMGQHVGGEVAGVYEYVHRSLKRLKDNSIQQLELADDKDKDKMKPMSCGSTKTLLKKLEMAAALQANSVARQKHLPKYFGSGSCEPTNSRITVPGIVSVPPWPIEHKQELQKVTGLLHSELSMVQHDVDSEATESSSGGESCDEMQNYNNPHQQYLSIQKRALWKYSTARAAIAGRWTWLQAQISDLEYRIRQHTDLHRQIRASKGEIRLGGASPPPSINSNNNNNNNNVSSSTTTTSSSSPTAVNGYRGQLPGSSPLSSKSVVTGETDTTVVTTTTTTTATTTTTTIVNGAYPDYQCARTRPLVNFKKRRLLQINGLHVISKKAARPSSVRCGCVQQSTAPCAVCTGRTDPTHPRDPPDSLSKAERIALVDPAFHPVFSLPEDVSYGIHCEAIMKNPEWQQRSTRMKSLKISKNDRSDKSLLEQHRLKKLDHRKKYNRLLKPSTVSALSAKIKNKIRGRKVGRHSSSSSTTSSFRKRSKLSTSQLQSLSGDGVDEEVESIGNNSNAAASNSAVGSPSSSPLLQIQTISGYNSRRTRTNSYDIDNIVIPYSVAAATRVEKLQYKEILTPKWRIADIDFSKCETKNNGAVRNPSQDSDVEDLSEEAVQIRHEKSEHDEKKKFLSYLKLPIGHGRSRAHKRTDSLAESSGANTPDPMSPHPADHPDNTTPLTSPPATPLPSAAEEPLPSVSAMRRRTVSQSRFVRDRAEAGREENAGGMETVAEAVAPYEARTFPLDDETYEKMLKNMPENHQFKTNARAQDHHHHQHHHHHHHHHQQENDYDHDQDHDHDQNQLSYLDKMMVDSPGSESTESAVGEEDPNDPEWVDMERSKDRHKR